MLSNDCIFIIQYSIVQICATIYFMKIKNLLLLWVLMAIAIIVMSIHNFQLVPGTPIELADSVAGNALFVCPAADIEMDNTAANLTRFRTPLLVIFSIFFMLWIAILGWMIYTALLKDKFEKKPFELPIFLGKFLLFIFILVLIMMKSPNHFRVVRIKGSPDNWVMCENNSPGAKPVRKDAVSAGVK